MSEAVLYGGLVNVIAVLCLSGFSWKKKTELANASMKSSGGGHGIVRCDRPWPNNSNFAADGYVNCSIGRMIMFRVYKLNHSDSISKP